MIIIINVGRSDVFLQFGPIKTNFGEIRVFKVDTDEIKLDGFKLISDFCQSHYIGLNVSWIFFKMCYSELKKILTVINHT